MNSPARDGWGLPGTSWSPSAKSPPSPAPAFDPALLEQVLRETSDAFLLEEPLCDGQRQAFLEVAGRYRGQPLTLEPVATELVLVVLDRHFRALPGFAQVGRALSKRIAETLLENPAVSHRLRSFWNRLEGAVA